ncbi:MAG: PhnD/SsuA/transferrin family substrate-binding protein [Pseudomonadota bacterium]
MSLASLPMYDWPQLRAETDGLWSAMTENLAQAGFEPPSALDRETTSAEVWNHLDLLLSQTCGLPHVVGTARRTRLICTPTYEVEGCAAGTYSSVLIARPDGPDAPQAARFAANGPDSLSGWAAPLAHLGEGAIGEVIWTGSHRASMMAVLEGRADFAALDAVVWDLAQRFEPVARALKVIGWTDPLPAPPFVTSAARPSGERARIRGAIAATLADPKTEPFRQTLRLVRTVAFADVDYDPVRETARAASAQLAARPDLQAAVARAEADAGWANA